MIGTQGSKNPLDPVTWKGFPIFVPFQFHGAEGVETEDEANRSRFFRSHRREHLRGVLACRHKWSGNLKRMWRYPKEAMRVLGIVFLLCNYCADKRLIVLSLPSRLKELCVICLQSQSIFTYKRLRNYLAENRKWILPSPNGHHPQ